MTRILFDSFHHMMPGHRIGRNIFVGGYDLNCGRYTPGDCYHPNGISFIHADLARDYEIRLLSQPFAEASLFDADILVCANPDYPLYAGASPHRLTPEDVDAVLAFAERGGGVLLLVNSFLSRPNYWEENFDLERVSLLFERLGLRWDPNYMSDDKTIEEARSGALRVGYGQGGRVWEARLPGNVQPLLTHGADIYGFKTPIGAGKLIVLGDAGMISNGLVCFPGFQNAAFFKDLFRELTPAWCPGSPDRWDCLGYAHLSAAPSPSGLTESILRGLRPKASWIEDHHYRHLVTDGKAIGKTEVEAWESLPVELGALVGGGKAEGKSGGTGKARLSWLSLDAGRPGPEVSFELTRAAHQSKDGMDVHLIGRTSSSRLTWADLCENPKAMGQCGTVDEVHTVFELRAVVRGNGRPHCARWSQGQILYARNDRAGHYGYEIILASQNGIIMPRARP